MRIFNNGGSGNGPIIIMGSKDTSSSVKTRFFSKKLITILGFLIKKLIASSSRNFIISLYGTL